MEVIADIKIKTKDGRVLFDEKRLFESESDISSFDNKLVRTEELRLCFKWISKEVEI